MKKHTRDFLVVLGSTLTVSTVIGLINGEFPAAFTLYMLLVIIGTYLFILF